MGLLTRILKLGTKNGTSLAGPVRAGQFRAVLSGECAPIGVGRDFRCGLGADLRWSDAEGRQSGGHDKDANHSLPHRSLLRLLRVSSQTKLLVSHTGPCKSTEKKATG